jgi:hypothetical protein
MRGSATVKTICWEQLDANDAPPSLALQQTRTLLLISILTTDDTLLETLQPTNTANL